MASSSLSLHWERMKLLAICSFNIKSKIYQKSSFQAINKEGRRMFQLLTKINTSKLQIFFMQKANMKMHYSFISCGLLHLNKWDTHIEIWRFWRQRWTKICFVLCKQEESKEEVHFSEELFTQVMNFKEMKVNNGTYQIRSFTTPTGKTTTGHLVFYLTRSKLQKKFSRKFAKLIPDVKSRPKDIRILSISNEFRGHGIQRASSLGLHTSVKTTQEHYTRIEKDFK